MTDSKAHAGCDHWVDYQNEAAPGISYFSPYQKVPAGTAINPQSDGKELPLLFQPLKIRGMTLQNRIMLSPLCQYSAQDGHLTDWHIAHLGGILQRGVALTMVEATAVQERGKISPQDSGLWKDSQIAPLKRVVEYAHSQNQKIGIQLAHAGRKASTVAPWLDRKATATKIAGGWPDDVWGPSDVPFDKESPVPHAMTLEDIEEFKKDYAAAVKRAVTAGVDTIEIHAAHGYLLHSFYSPYSNKRTDKYGGSFENRIRIVLEVAELSRANMPNDMPLFIRLTGSDWLEHLEVPSWKVEDAVNLALALAQQGAVDFFDVSSAANSTEQEVKGGPGYQVHFAEAIKKALNKAGYDKKLFVGTVGSITEGNQAATILAEGKADVAVVGRQLLKDPYLVWTWARDLDLEIQLANQQRWPFPYAGKHRL